MFVLKIIIISITVEIYCVIKRKRTYIVADVMLVIITTICLLFVMCLLIRFCCSRDRFPNGRRGRIIIVTTLLLLFSQTVHGTESCEARKKKKKHEQNRYRIYCIILLYALKNSEYILYIYIYKQLEWALCVRHTGTGLPAAVATGVWR